MASAEVEHIEETPKRRLLPRRRRWRALLLLLSLVGFAAVWVWIAREEYAGNFIDAELAKLGLPAEYEIESIGPQRQVLRDLVIGDPDRPDLTVERIAIDLEYGFGAPQLGRIEVQGARLFGTLKDGELSFGSLDSVLFAESEEPAGLPELDLKLVDTGALIDSDYGAIGIKTSGEGLLSDGFAGTIAATAPGFAVQGCEAATATLYGDVTTDGGRPSFSGPVRLRDLACEGDMRLASADIAADVTLAADFASAEGELGLSASQLAVAGSQADALGGEVQLSWQEGMLAARHDLAAEGTVSSFGAIEQLTADGTFRSRDGFARNEWDARIEGEGAALGSALVDQLGAARKGAEGTLVEPLLAKFERSLADAATGGSLAADVTLRVSPESMSLVMPEARLRAASSETLLGLSRFAWSSSQNAPGRLSGNIATGGEGIPRISGRMERQGGGDLALRLQMQEYAAGSSRFAVPEMQITQAPNGALRFDGLVRATGDIPGGLVQGLAVPLKGTWGPDRGLALGQSCTDVRFQRASIYALTLDQRSVSLCPGAGGAMLRYDDTLQVSAVMPGLALDGDLAGSPLALRSDRVEFTYPGAATARDVAVTIGGQDEAFNLALETLEANFGEQIAGTFSGGTAALDIVPLDLEQVSGEWAYVDDTLQVSDGAFQLLDREAEDRFEPLAARDATLELAGNSLSANANLNHPESDRLVTTVDIVHDLGTSVGSAQISVPRLVFDRSLQPADLSNLTKGVISLANGVVTGTGQINWTADEITSGGTFSTESLDFAAAFGPVKDARATIEFTDLLSFTTAPSQVIELGSINTGIEVFGGRVRYALEQGQLVKVEDARWPFMGGELIMRPIDLNFAVSEERSYIFEIINLDAGTFISEMEFGNLSASGTFNGTIPIIFDVDGNGRIEGGLLISEPPGGNLSYVGELTYEDMGAITNYAFNSLRSLDYRQMAVTMDGNLTGEIITSIRFDGITQGEGADQNLITRQIARLPIRFNINVRSQFLELTRLLRSTYDSTYLRDPCLTSDPKWRASRFYQVACQNTPDVNPEDEPLDDLSIQPQESETTP